MLDQELKKIWQNSPQEEQLKFNHSKLLMDMDYSLKNFERDVRNRDLREVIVSILLMPVMVAIAFFIPAFLSKIGIALIVLALAFIVFKLKNVKKYKKEIDPVGSVKEQLLGMRHYVIKQKDLLDNVLYWYLLPLFIGIVLFFIGLGDSVLKTTLLIGIAVVVCAGIYWINKKAVKEYYGPLLAKLHTAIELLKSEL